MEWRAKREGCMCIALKQIVWIGGSSSKYLKHLINNNNKLMEMMRLQDG